MAKKTALDIAYARIVKDEELIGDLLEALQDAQVPLDEGSSYRGEVLEVAAGVREAIQKAKRRLKGKPRAFQVPKFDIEFLVNREHIGTPNDAITALITDRCGRGSNMTPENVALCVKYALEVHEQNRVAYDNLMCGKRKK
jgi:hypothetical protein